MVLADVQRLEQVLTDLLCNPIKYAPDQNCVELSLETRDGLAVVGVRGFRTAIY